MLRHGPYVVAGLRSSDASEGPSAITRPKYHLARHLSEPDSGEESRLIKVQFVRGDAVIRRDRLVLPEDSKNSIYMVSDVQLQALKVDRECRRGRTSTCICAGGVHWSVMCQIKNLEGPEEWVSQWKLQKVPQGLEVVEQIISALRLQQRKMRGTRLSRTLSSR